MSRVLKTKSEFEGRVYEELTVAEGEGLPPWDPAALAIVGRGKSRVDGPDKVTGGAVYTADIHLPGMLYGRILRSPFPHARIRSMDFRAAEKRTGIRSVLTPFNVPRIPFYGGQTSVLDTTVRYAGEEVACVIGDEEEACQDALEKIAVEYEELPFVLTVEKALEAGAPEVQPGGNVWRGKPEVYERGGAEKAFSEAEVVIEDVFKTQTALHNCMETHGSVVLWQGDRVTIWDSTQNIFGVRRQFANLFRLDLNKVRVIKQFMGGGFGSKNSLGRYTAIAGLGSRRTGRPVKIMLDRLEENLCAGNRPASTQHLRIGAKKDGTLTAIRLKAYSAVGAYIMFPPAVSGPARQLYACPNVKTEHYNVLTHTGPLSSFRAPGYVEGTFALESMMDELAKKLDMDPLALRIKNDSSLNQVTNQPYSSKGLKEAYARAAALIGWKERRREEKGTLRRGFGMASQIWDGSGGPPAYALVKINPDGTATVITGTQDLGTGTRTVLAQIAAEELRFPMEMVSVQIGDTEAGYFAPLSAGSMTLPSVGPAVRFAAHDAREQLLDVAAQVLGKPRESLDLRDGVLRGASLSEPVPVKDVLSEVEDFMPIGKGARSPNPEGFHVNTFGAQFVQVAVDTETGEVTVEKVAASHECGRVINPLTLSSQVEGGIIQGLGFGLIEERIVDRNTGVVVNGDLEDYKVPTCRDIAVTVQDMVDLPDPRANSIGSKGAG
ncbi:MAG TPA: xanthine dehydrogenase family protein molybdopterin-binding subunit, partial [Thermodesulfobacteriota bacterium]|nr:xanthine dehydrogenase family protein molybdopterin-binding subunit [Thermodesulfobacteriota bacterium]